MNWEYGGRDRGEREDNVYSERREENWRYGEGVGFSLERYEGDENERMGLNELWKSVERGGWWREKNWGDKRDLRNEERKE